MSKRVIIFEPNFSGHRLQYVAHLIDIVDHHLSKIIFATHPETLESVEYNTLLKPHRNKFEVYDVCTSFPLNKLTKKVIAKELIRLQKNFTNTIFFIPYLDYVFYHYPILSTFIEKRGNKVSGILFRGNFAYSQIKHSLSVKAKGVIAKYISKSDIFDNIFVLDELVLSYLQKSTSDSQRLKLCPDPIDMGYPDMSIEDLRVQLNLPTNSKIIGTLGMIDFRKGIDKLLKGFIQSKLYEKGVYILLVGKQKDEVKNLLKKISGDNSQAYGKIISINHFVTNEEFLRYIKAMDVVSVLYHNHIGPASILLRAMAANKTIIATDFGWIGHIASKYERAITVKNDQDIAGTLKESISYLPRNAPASDKAIDFFSIESFQKTVSTTLKLKDIP